MSVVQTFTERAQATQVIYQTLLQGFARNQVDVVKGVSATDAELLHRLSALSATLTSTDPIERKNAWKEISNLSDLAVQFFSVFSTPTTPQTSSTYNIPEGE